MLSLLKSWLLCWFKVLRFRKLFGFRPGLLVSPRNNGFLNMFELMQKKALMLYADAEKGSESRIVENLEKDIDSG